MNIAYIITGLACGGAEVQLATLYKELKNDHNVRIFSIVDNREILSRFDRKDVKFYNIANIKDIVIFFKDIKRFRPDVIHSHMIHSNIISPIISWILDVPCLVTAHNTNEGGYFRMLILKLVLKLFKPVVFHVSEKGINDYIKNGLCKKAYKYINPVDLKEFSSGNLNRNESVRWINIASLTKQKRHDRLIKVFKNYNRLFPNDYLFIVGDGPQRGECESLLFELNLSSNVKLLGRKDNISQELLISDYFILSSDWEGLPVSIVEALSCNLPIVATNCGDINTIISDGFNGFISDISDDDLLNKMILARSLSDENYSKMANNCIGSSIKFDVCNVANNMVVLYSNLINKNKKV